MTFPECFFTVFPGSFVYLLPLCRWRRSQHLRLLRHFRHKPLRLQHWQPTGHLDRTHLRSGWNLQPRACQSDSTERGEAVSESSSRQQACDQAPAAPARNRSSEFLRQRHCHLQPFLLLWKFLLLHRQFGYKLWGGVWFCFQFASSLGPWPEPLFLPDCLWTWVPGTFITEVPVRLFSECFAGGQSGHGEWTLHTNRWRCCTVRSHCRA